MTFSEKEEACKAEMARRREVKLGWCALVIGFIVASVGTFINLHV